MKNMHKFLDRMEQGFKLLLKKVPPRRLIRAYYLSEDFALQEFCADNGPSWCMGISVIDAAEALADGIIGGGQTKKAFLEKMLPTTLEETNGN